MPSEELKSKEFPYVDENGALYLITKVLSLLAKKVNAETGKTLIDTTDLQKLTGIEAGAEVNTIDVVKVNNVVQEIKDKTLSLTILTKEEVSTLIAAAIGSAINLSYSIVSELPQTGQDNVIYLIANNSKETNNIYDEYIYIKSTGKFEKLGSTKLDLSGYLKETDLVPISNAEIDEMFESAEPIE